MTHIEVIEAESFVKSINRYSCRRNTPQCFLVDIHCYSKEDYEILKQAELDGVINMYGNEIILIEE